MTPYERHGVPSRAIYAVLASAGALTIVAIGIMIVVGL